MNALQVMDRTRKEVIQVSTEKNDVKVQYLYDTETSGNTIDIFQNEIVIFYVVPSSEETAFYRLSRSNTARWTCTILVRVGPTKV